MDITLSVKNLQTLSGIDTKKYCHYIAILESFLLQIIRKYDMALNEIEGNLP